MSWIDAWRSHEGFFVTVQPGVVGRRACPSARRRPSRVCRCAPHGSSAAARRRPAPSPWPSILDSTGNRFDAQSRATMRSSTSPPPAVFNGAHAAAGCLAPKMTAPAPRRRGDSGRRGSLKSAPGASFRNSFAPRAIPMGRGWIATKTRRSSRYASISTVADAEAAAQGILPGGRCTEWSRFAAFYGPDAYDARHDQTRPQRMGTASGFP